MEYMRTKSHETGPLKLIQYSISESHEWADNSRWQTGETLEQLGEGFFICSKFMKI